MFRLAMSGNRLETVSVISKCSFSGLICQRVVVEVSRFTKLFWTHSTMEIKPLILIAGYSAYPRKVNFKRMSEIAHKVGATFMAQYQGLGARPGCAC